MEYHTRAIAEPHLHCYKNPAVCIVLFFISLPRNPKVTLATHPRPGRWNTRDLINLFGPFIGLALVLILFSINTEVRHRFLSGDNFGLVATQTVIVALGALGMTVIIISGGIDLSVGSGIAVSGVVVALILRMGRPPWIAVVVAVLAAIMIGCVNGGLISGLKMTPFIVTLGTLGVARGLANWLAQEQSVDAPKTWINNIALPSQVIFGVPISPGVWITLVMAVAMAILLRYTQFGRHVFAVGSNEVAGRLSGLHVDRLKVMVYALGGFFVGLAGVMQFARLGQGDPTAAIGDELDIIAAVVIGGASLNGGEGSILGSILGALIMAFLRNGSVQMGWSSYVQEIMIGTVIIAAVALDRLRHRTPGKAISGPAT